MEFALPQRTAGMTIGWASWLGIALAVVNLLLVLSVLLQGESPWRAVAWSIVPALILFT